VLLSVSGNATGTFETKSEFGDRVSEVDTAPASELLEENETDDETEANDTVTTSGGDEDLKPIHDEGKTLDTDGNELETNIRYRAEL
jgi:hypothetical protein